MLKILRTLAMAGLVAACGGGGSDAGDSPFGGGNNGGGTPRASDLSLALSSTNVSNSGGAVTVTVTAVNEGRVALAGVPVSVGADNNAVVVMSAGTTDSSGVVTATVSLGADRSNRLITVRATSGSLSRAAAFQVTGAKLVATLSPAVVTPGTAAQIQYRLTDANDNAMAGQDIVVSGAGLTGASGTTGSNGQYVFSYTAPATTGNLDITAVAGGVTFVQTVLVQPGASAILPAIDDVQSDSVSANPSVVSINTDGTQNRSEIRARFIGSGNAPIERVRVRFDTAGDPNSIGGAMSTASNVVYSDANGVAVSAYVPGSRSSPTDGVTVRACWSISDFAAGTCPNQATVSLTVVSEALAVTIGTNSEIEDGAQGLTYIKKFVVLVVDAAGQAKADVQLSPSIDLPFYFKGSLALGDTAPSCPNEDVNRNGVLEVGEDANNNGALEPRKSDVAISMVGGNRTNANGIAILQIEYPKNVATWIEYNITVAASGVSGTEGRALWSGRRLPASVEDFNLPSPPFRVSPYGVADSCSDRN